jgi:GTPase binding
LLSYHNREFLVGQAPQLVKATSTYCVEGRLKIEQNDTIAIIDGRPELSFLKGQNQRTFEIGTFPRNILEVLRFNRHGTLNTISRPVHGTLQHSAHGAAFGPTWGSPSFLDSSYNGKVQMRQKTGEQVSKSHRQQRTLSEHFTKEKKVPPGKQFNYNKLVNEQHQRLHYDQQQAMRSRPKPARPPAPQTQPQEGILIDLSPEEIRSMKLTLQSQASVSKQPLSSGCILDEPIEVPTEGFLAEEQHHIAPPPYPMPPQYLNTSSLNDPFDTTHLNENLYSNASVQMRPEPIYNNNPNRYTTSALSDPLSELLSSSLASMSVAGENINGQPVTPKKVEKQLLGEQLVGAKDNHAKLSLDQLMNAPPTMAATRSYCDPFSPIQADQTFVNNNYSATYGNQSATDARSVYEANIYNSVAGDSVYGENFYDAVQSQAPSVIYDSTASIYSAQQQQAIYDEVSAYDGMRWQPQAAALRPAPAPPLSQQQINRRLEKINQQHSVVAELMNKLSMDNMTEEEAKAALDISNWNQDLATRHFKIERLAK